MPESVNCWMPIPSPAGQLFHADPHPDPGEVSEATQGRSAVSEFL